MVAGGQVYAPIRCVFVLTARSRGTAGGRNRRRKHVPLKGRLKLMIMQFRHRQGRLPNSNTGLARSMKSVSRLLTGWPNSRSLLQHRSPLRQSRSILRRSVTMNSSTAAKIALFRSLFRGREDVFPRRWDNAKTGKIGLFAGMPQRMGSWRLRQAASEMRRVSEPSVPARYG